MHNANNTLSNRLQHLYARQTLGIKLGLDVTRRLLEFLGQPHNTFSCIHVAGTNGKGSVCAMLDSILRAAGYTVGLYTSPHLVRFNERIRVNGRMIGDDELVELMDRTDGYTAHIRDELGREPTFFEFTTALCFEHFRRNDIDIAVLETGMGGRLDSTNVVDPLVSIIMPISLEHTRYLGPDLATIAAEKAGIIKPSRPVIVAQQDDTVMAVIRRVAAEQGAPCIEAAGNASVYRVSQDVSGQKVSIETADTNYGTINLPLLGKHQLENAGTAVTAIEALNAESTVMAGQACVKKGLSSVRWPGRMQVLSTAPLILLDGAHNPGAAEALARQLELMAAGRPVGLIVGMCEDKDAKTFLKLFGKSVKNCWVVPIRDDRNMPGDQLVAAAEAQGWRVEASTLSVARDKARIWAEQCNAMICICGSLFLVGEVLETGTMEV